MVESRAKRQTFDLKEHSELRCEIGADEKVELRLLEGTAEYFGTELAADTDYRLTACQFAIFSWHGCRIQMSGRWSDQPYISQETPMIQYINTNGNLENMRRYANKKIEEFKEQDTESIVDPSVPETMAKVHKIMKEQSATFGPKVLIVGPKDCGKSSIARILANYAVRLRWKPTVVDLDPGQNMISIPGTVAAVGLERPFDVETGLDALSPLVYYYGEHSPEKKLNLYRKCVENLSNVVKKRMCKNLEARASGVIISTCGWVNDDRARETILHAATMFAVDVILVIDHERLQSYLSFQHEMRANKVAVVKLQKSGGVVSRSSKLRTQIRKRQINNYFYGPRKDLHPHQQVIGFHEVTICQIGRGYSAPSSLLPIGSASVLDPNMVLTVKPTAKVLKGKNLALSYAETLQETSTANIVGFLQVINVDEKRQKLTLLNPYPGPLPGRFLLVT